MSQCKLTYACDLEAPVANLLCSVSNVQGLPEIGAL